MSVESFLSGVRRTVLSNGLTLLTREHRRGGVVAINTWVKAGYFHEPDEVAGMAHLFEHMFFKGSKKFPGPEEIATHVSTLGGVTNAGTIYDSTNYYFVLPRDGFERGVEIQADAILNPLFDPDELKKEAEVVIEESNRKLDNPPAVALERMFETAFTRHRMRRWRIGSHDVLRNIRREHLIEFFETLYRPENIVVSIVGDIAHDEAIRAVDRYFGIIPKGTLAKERGPQEPPQEQFRYGESFGDIRQSFSVFGWHTPGEHSEDEEALELLSTILGDGRYSRLFRRVVGNGANSVAAFNSVFEDVGMLSIRASFDDDAASVVETKVLAEIEKLKRDGITQFELQLAKNKLESEAASGIEDVLGQAQALAHYEARGSYTDFATHLARLRSVTIDDVAAAARRHLTIDNLTLYRYRAGTAERTTREAALEHVRTAATIASDEYDELPMPAASRILTEARSAGALQRFVLSNGVSLYVKEEPDSETTACAVYFKGGKIRETSGNSGITQLMVRSMRRGTASRDAETIDRELEFLGTQLSLHVDDDYFGVFTDVLSRNFAATADVICDVLLHPVFPESEVEEEKRLQIAAIRRSFDSAGDRPFQLFARDFYGDHPYALPVNGSEVTIDALTADDLRDWHSSTVVSDAAQIFVVGSTAADDVRRLFEESLSVLSARGHLQRAVVLPHAPRAPRISIELRDRRQSAIVIGFPSVPPSHPDSVPLRVLQEVVSGLAGTFFIELRARRSLAYTVFARDASRQLAGSFVGYIATDAAKEEQARDALLNEMRRLAVDGISESDVLRAKSCIAGTTKIRLQTNTAIAIELARDVLLGLGLDHVERFLARVKLVSLDDLKMVAKTYLTGENYVVAIVRGKQPSETNGHPAPTH